MKKYNHLTHEQSYSSEMLIEHNPDYVIVRKEDSAAFCNKHPYNRLSAVRDGRVIAIESSTIDLQVPRNIAAVRFIHQRIGHRQ